MNEPSFDGSPAPELTPEQSREIDRLTESGYPIPYGEAWQKVMGVPRSGEAPISDRHGPTVNQTERTPQEPDRRKLSPKGKLAADQASPSETRAALERMGYTSDEAAYLVARPKP